MVSRSGRLFGVVGSAGAAAAAGVMTLALALPAAVADSGLETPPLRPMATVMLSSELQFDLGGEVSLGVGRFGQWLAAVQVPLFYRSDDDFLGYGVHDAVRLWPQVLGGGVFLEPNLGLTSGLSDGERQLGFGGGLSFGYTFHFGAHTALSAKAGFDVAPVAARGFFGVELLVH